MSINMLLMPRYKWFSLVFIASFFATPVLSQTAEEKGLELAKEQKHRDSGWQDSVAEMTMILYNARGEKSERKIRSKAFEVENDGDKSLTIFDQPRDVKGTAFLTFSHANKPDDQWIFLPALKRVKRISSRNKSGPFMGSEFAYEDMTSFELEKFSFKYLGDETLRNRDMFVLEQIPTDKFSGYSRQKVWLDKERYVPYKVEYYDKKNSLLKTLTLYDYTLYDGKFWRALKLEMVNNQNGKKTDLITHTIEFKTGLEEKDFDKNSLKRAR